MVAIHPVCPNNTLCWGDNFMPQMRNTWKLITRRVAQCHKTESVKRELIMKKLTKKKKKSKFYSSMRHLVKFLTRLLQVNASEHCSTVGNFRGQAQGLPRNGAVSLIVWREVFITPTTNPFVYLYLLYLP